MTRGEPIDSGQAKTLVDTAERIIAWVENLLPASDRRAKTEATGPFRRRMATPEEADALGRARLIGGQLGQLRAGDSVALGFEDKPAAPPAQDGQELVPPDGQH